MLAHHHCSALVRQGGAVFQAAFLQQLEATGRAIAEGCSTSGCQDQASGAIITCWRRRSSGSQQQWRCSTSSSSSVGSSSSSTPAFDAVRTSFAADAHSASRQLVDTLSAAQRKALLEVLSSNESNGGAPEDLVPSRVDAKPKEEAAPATTGPATPVEVPGTQALKAVFIAAAIPFVGFGFLDNFIMLTAGEEIDAVFGARLGLTTLASAGLGNLIADVIGVSAATTIESAVRKLPYIKHQPRLSRAQLALPRTKAAKLLGASLGVALGCVMGLTPLVYQGAFFTR